MNKLETALFYAQNGLAVFPLRPNQKEPITEHGCKDASTDESIIKKWWGKYAEANIGIATGCISGGIVVIDLDVKGEKNGIESFNKWIDDEFLTIPQSWMSKTWSGGRHIFYKSSEPVKSRVGWLPGVDVRAEGGYVVAPSSVINGEYYEWEISPEDMDVTDDKSDPDVWYILDCIRRSSAEQKSEPFVLPDKIEDGSRNDTLYKYACSLQAKGYTDDEIKILVHAKNDKDCNPPLDDEEVERTINSALTKKKGTAKRQTVQEDTTEVTDYDTDMQSMDEMEEEEQRWLIPNYIPFGSVTLLCSDGGLGKTTMWCSILADITSGRPTIFDRIDEYPYPVKGLKAMYFSKEDSSKKVLHARLRENKANMKNIITFDLSDERLNKIWYGSKVLEANIEKHKPDICVFDTLQAFLPDKTNISDRKSMRDALTPLSQLGDKYGTAFLLIMHSNKSNNSGRQRMADSSDIWDLGRSALMIGRTKDKDVLYVSHEKSNYGKLQPTILFSVNDKGLEFRGTTNKKDRDFVLESQQLVVSTPKKQEAMDFIIEQLIDNHGKMTIHEMESVAKSVGITPSTLQDARAQLIADKKIDRKPTGYGEQKKWFLILRENNPQ